jgi:chromosomal replication initiation ATPase DnaA
MSPESLTKELTAKEPEESPPIRSISGIDYQGIWHNVDRQLASQMQPALYRTYVKPLQPAGYTDGVFRLVAEPPVAAWVESRLGRQIAHLLEPVFCRPVQLAFLAPEAARAA